MRCDLGTNCTRTSLRYFNPRTSCEVRLTRYFVPRNVDNFNPRTSCEVRLEIQEVKEWVNYFNPRTSCEVRLNYQVSECFRLIFQSTHLVWGATVIMYTKTILSLFQSTHLVWGATLWIIDLVLLNLFQSTHLVWGATKTVIEPAIRFKISIHAPRVRCDFWRMVFVWNSTYFNPRTSCEVRQRAWTLIRRLPLNFNPRTSCEVRQCCH